MDLILLGFLLVSAFLIPFKLIKMVSSSKATTSKLPPGPPRWPVLGNLLQLGQLPHRDMDRLCDKYGPLVYLRLGSVDAITTNDPVIINQLLVKQDEVFSSRRRTCAATHLAYGCNDVALAPMGQKWKRMRRICMEHLLTTKRLESFSKQRTDEAHNLVYDVYMMSKRGEDVNLRGVLGAFSMNNGTRMLFGKRFMGVESSGKEEAVEFIKNTHELFLLLGLIYLGDYLPFWRWFDPYGWEKKMRAVEKRVDDFHNMIIEERRNERGENTGNDQVEGKMDFVDILLSLPGEDGNEHLDDLQIKALIQVMLKLEDLYHTSPLPYYILLSEVQDMIAAAIDTSAVTNEWAIAEVIKQPSILKKIQEELDIVVGHDRMVSESDLAHLNYLRCVVRETFRMHPAAPFLIPHESIRDTTINGYIIPAKTLVFINTHGLGRNTKIWGEDIDEFRPERHFPENVGDRVELSHGSDFKILPFGAGKRKCPGSPLGITLVLMALARLFHSFDWSPTHGMKHEDIDTNEVYGMTMPKAKPLVAVAKPRLPIHLYQL